MKIINNFDFSEYNSLNIHYHCKFMFEIENAYEIYVLLYLFNEFNIDYYVIGNGSKILFKNNIINKPIIYINTMFSDLKIYDDNILVSSGFLLSNLIVKLAKNNIGGFEKLYPIPATIGGAIFMNCGINEYSISNFVRYVIALDENLNIIKLSNEQCKFEYRKSIFMSKKYIILYVSLSLKNIEKNIILNSIKQAILYRKISHGIYKNTIGSLFKNPQEEKAFKLIKNTFPNSISINGASVSKTHCNMLVCDNATNDDVIKLITIIREEVYKKYIYFLELELNILE